jgi:AcrR family transcriptional regulator
MNDVQYDERLRMPTEPTTRSSRPRAKWGDRAARHEEIRQAAVTMLERDGLSGLSMRAVATEARVGLGTLYTYFASKEALYADLYAERLERLTIEIRSDCVDAETLEQVFVLVAERYFDVYRVFGRELNLWSPAEASLPVEAASRLVGAAFGVFAAVYALLDRLDPRFEQAGQRVRELSMQTLWASVNGLADHFAGPRRTLHAGSRAEVVEFAARTLVAGVRAQLA